MYSWHNIILHSIKKHLDNQLHISTKYGKKKHLHCVSQKSTLQHTSYVLRDSNKIRVVEPWINSEYNYHFAFV